MAEPHHRYRQYNRQTLRNLPNMLYSYKNRARAETRALSSDQQICPILDASPRGIDLNGFRNRLREERGQLQWKMNWSSKLSRWQLGALWKIVRVSGTLRSQEFRQYAGVCPWRILSDQHCRNRTDPCSANVGRIADLRRSISWCSVSDGLCATGSASVSWRWRTLAEPVAHIKARLTMHWGCPRLIGLRAKLAPGESSESRIVIRVWLKSGPVKSETDCAASVRQILPVRAADRC